MLYSSGRLRPHVYPYFPLIMPVDQPFHVYREQLSSQYHGIALWNPNPVKRLYDCGHVSIGDVGYLCDGDFIRMFNVTLPWDDPSNQKLGKPEEYKTLDRGRFVNARDGEIPQTEYNSSHVSKVENAGNVHAETPDETKGQTYKCRTRSCGALLSLPHGGHREDVIHAKAFEYYIRDHVVDWFTWAQNNKLGVERMEDLILVTGCTLVTSWAAAAFDNYTKPVDATSISLHAQKFDCGGAQFLWSNVRGNVEYHNSQFDLNNEKREPLPRNQCVFIRGFRAKRTFFRTKYLRAAAEPLPDDPNNRQDDEIQATQVPDVLKYRDPLIGILDYIAEKCVEDAIAEDTIAIAHDDDLQLIKDVEILTADAIEKFLREKQMALLVKNGAATLHPCNNEPLVSDEKISTFYATAELNGKQVQLVIHPVLTKSLLKLEMTQSLDHDYGLPKEELTSPAVHPPILSLKLESHQGYPQAISIETSGDSGGVGVTVQDVLRTILKDLRIPIPTQELSKLGDRELAEIDAAFGERCKSEEELSEGPRRIDYLCGRDRLRILPKLSPDGSVLLPTSTPTPA